MRMAINLSTIKVNAPVEKLWDALTEPELVKKWQYGSDVITDWKEGSPIRFKTQMAGKVFEQWGTILKIIPLQLISYSLFAPRPNLEDKPENYFVMNYKLTPEGKHTILEITQEDNRQGAVQAKPQGEENPVLAGLKSIVESL
jgi:uncharacterized protein YndB with AHSA1/START domain